MTTANRVESEDSYNAAAIALAERLSTARRAAAESQPPIDDPSVLFNDRNRVSWGVAQEYARMGSRPVSEALERRASAFGADFEHLGLTLGTIIHGVHLDGELSGDLIAFLRAVLLERKVIFFRDQHLDEAQQVAFGRCFGALDAFPFGQPGKDPFILEIVHGKRSPGTENGWHTDVTWMEEPSLGSIAQCVELPAFGGDTLFADSHAAFLGLRPALQARLRTLEGVNDYRNFIANLPQALQEEYKAAIPFGVTQPLLRTHPETRKTALWFHGGFLRHTSLKDTDTGERLPEDEARAVVRELQQQHGRPEYTCRFTWAPGSIAFWDNRAVQHYAASDYYPERRVLRRVTVRGDRPYYAAGSDPLDV
ncbi:MAG: TauD/TfdA family dioxygenase [Pseudomonadales bacterium]|nr:TauD/TfdA family dioxygenase [Pseudomonadales bacterium]